MANDGNREHSSGLTFGDFAEANEPFGLFAAWMEEAKKSESRDPDAMALATVDQDGLPNVRMVLLKQWGPGGFVFYTNSESTKGHELAGQPKAALALYWKSLSRQVRIRGDVDRVSDAESDAYFTSRPRGAQIGAWASQQSRPLKTRSDLEAAAASYSEKYADAPVPRPSYWIGYRIVPLEIEFWAEQSFRLHDRIVFSRSRPGAPWQRTRLYP